MHIGLVVDGSLSQTSGGYRYDRKLVSYCREKGDTVEVVSLPERSYPRALLGGLSRSLRRRLDRPVDVLIGDNLSHSSLFYHAPRLDGPGAVVALVHHLRSDDPTDWITRRCRPVERRYLRSVDAVVATSAFLRDRVNSLAPESRPNLVAPPAGRAEGAALSRERVAERARNGPLEVLFVGNLVPRKDPRTLLDAVSRLDCDWRLTVVGSHEAAPEYAQETVASVDELGMNARVEFAGEVTDGRLKSLLERSHVCCVPSRYEAFGMVYLEAMEYGVVPIASAVGGAREFVSDGESGYLVRPGASREIAARLDRLASDRDALAAMGTAALSAARTHPGWEETMARVRSFLRRVSE